MSRARVCVFYSFLKNSSKSVTRPIRSDAPILPYHLSRPLPARFVPHCHFSRRVIRGERIECHTEFLCSPPALVAAVAFVWYVYVMKIVSAALSLVRAGKKYTSDTVNVSGRNLSIFGSQCLESPRVRVPLPRTICSRATRTEPNPENVASRARLR